MEKEKGLILMPGKKPNFKRKKYLVKKRFQFKFISIILLFIFTTAVVTGYMVYFTTWIMFGEKLAAVYPQGLLFDIVKKVNMVLLVRLLCLSPLVFLIGLILSHRIAGPIYHIQRFLGRLAQGDYDVGELKLREKDELKEIAFSINTLAYKLRDDRKFIGSKIEKMLTDISCLYDMLQKGEHDREVLVEKVSALQGVLKDCAYYYSSNDK